MGMFQTEGFPNLDLSFLFCPFLGLSRLLGDFPDVLWDGPGIFPIGPFLFLGLLRAPTRNSPERVRDTIWTFPEKSGKPPGLETPRFSFFQVMGPLLIKGGTRPFVTRPLAKNRRNTVGTELWTERTLAYREHCHCSAGTIKGQ